MKVENTTVKWVKRVRKYLTEREVSAVLEELSTPFDLISNLMVHTGRRPTEVLLVKPNDIDHEHKMIEFIQLKKRGKKIEYSRERKPRERVHERKKVTKPIDISDIYDKLIKYMERTPSNMYLFPSDINDSAHVDIRTLQRKVRLAGENCGIPIHPHMFRHTFAVRYLEKRINVDKIDPIQALFELKNILGHASIDTTMGYLSYVTGKESLKGLWS